MTKPRKPTDRQAAKTAPTHDSQRKPSRWSWAAFAVPAAAIVVIVALGGGGETEGPVSVGAAAPGFDLPATDGTRQTRDDVLSEGDALLYFSMGPGCDGCFAQIPEIDEALAERGINLVPVMVDPAPLVTSEALRFGITDPILIDADRSVSEAYGMIGIYGHADRPSHSFALVNSDAEVTWIGHYAEMFVPTDQLLADMVAGS